MLGLGKIVLFMALMFAGYVQPFAGANATKYFVQIGHRIATEGKFNDVDSRDDTTVAPGYPFVLALLEWAGLRNALWAVVCLQYLADTAVALLLLRMGSNMGSVRVGFLAGLAWLLYPPAWIIASWVATESLFTMFFIAGMACLCAGPGKREGWGGLWMGIANMFRANALFLPVLFVAYWVWKRAYRTAVVFSLLFGITVALWTIRNVVVLNDFIVVSSNFGSTFMQGSDERFYNDKGTEYPILFAQSAAAGIKKPVVEKGSAINAWLFRIGLWQYQRQIQANGWVSVAGMQARKFIKMWYLVESGNRRSEIVLFLCALVMLPLGLLELATWFKPADQARFFCALTVTYWILIHSLIVPLTRYMVPVFPVIILAATFRAERIWRRRTAAKAASPAGEALPVRP